MEPADGMLIKVTRNGPYLVSGSVPLTCQAIVADADGESAEWALESEFDDREKCGLCRCGQSGRKPFCDGSHMDAAFDGTETASRVPYAERAIAIPGPTLTLFDVPELCAEARFCHRAGAAWNLVKSPTEEAAAIVVAECADCPSGRYTAADAETGEPVEPEFEPSIALVEDPEKDRSGPIWVRGGIQVEAVDGHRYEVRNRLTLCRCGKSSNKPFCDGTHIECGFRAHT
jgi:CDGSH-type Zn-finger protein